MPSTPEDLEWIDISDFTPGMTSTTEPTIAASAADGAAESATYCLPGPSGVGLVPAPRFITSYSTNAPSVPIGVTTVDPNQNYAMMLDFQTVGVPVANPSSSATSTIAMDIDHSVFPVEDEFAFLWQYYDMAVNSNRQVSRIEMHHVDGLTMSAGSIAATATDTRSFSVPSAASDPTNFHTTNLDYGPGSIDRMMVKPGTQTQAPGWSMIAAVDTRPMDVPIAEYTWSYGQAWAWGGQQTVVGVSGWFTLTRTPASGFGQWQPAGADTISVNLASRTSPILAFSHQGRGVVVAGGSRYGDFGGTYGGNYQSVDVQAVQSLRFSTPGNGFIPDFYTGYLDIFEPIGGIVAACSLSSDDLFLLGATGGGVRVRGPLDSTSVSITRHPMLPSGYGRATHITPTPVGLVWGTRNGVWLWNGGDTAENIAPQLSYDFWWDNTAMGRYAYQQPKGRPVCSYPYLFFPNGWICDLRFKAWFRFGRRNSTNLSYPSFWSMMSNGDVAAAHPLISYASRPDADRTVITRYDPSQFHDSWNWKSQPLARSRNRVLSFREIGLTVLNPSNTCTLQFTLSGADPANGSTVTTTRTLTITAADKPQTIRIETSLDCVDAQLELNVIATTGSTIALSLHRISLGFLSGRSAARR